MSAEVPVSDEVEQVAAELHQVALTETGLDEKLQELTNEWKAAGGDEKLLEAISSVKNGSTDKTAFISVLMDCDKFVSMLIPGLQAKNVEMQLGVMSVVELILEGEGGPGTDKMIGSEIIPAMITLLTSEDDAVCQQALSTLSANAFHESSADHLRNSEIIPALIKVAEGTEKVELLDNIATIVLQVCPRPIDNLNLPVIGYVGLSLTAVHELIRLFRILMSKEKDKEITSLIGTCVPAGIGGVSRVEGSFGMIVSSGILPSVVDLLSGPEKYANLAILAALTSLIRAAQSDQERLDFFQALRGSSGLNQFWIMVFYMKRKPEDPEDEGEGLLKKNLTAYINVFLNELNKALQGDLRSEIVEALIETGFVLSLVKCLEKEAEVESQMTTIVVLAFVVQGMRTDKLKPILKAGLVPLLLELLKNSDARARMAAPICLKEVLLIRKSVVRDEIVRLGGLQQMIRMLKDETFGPELSVIRLLAAMFEVKPKLPLEMYQGLPEGLKVVLTNEARYNSQGPVTVTHLLEDAFACVFQLMEYGDSGIDLMMRAGLYQVFVRALASGENEEKVSNSLILVVRACMMKQEYRDKLLEVGLLGAFPGLLRDPSDKLRQYALFCIKLFVDGRLAPERAKAILDMKPLIQAEKIKGLPLTLETATVLLSDIEEKLQK